MATVVLVGLALILPNDVTRKYLALFYFIQISALIIPYGFDSKWSLEAFVKPSMIAILYIGGSIALGALSYSSSYVVIRRTFYIYNSWQFVGESFAIIATSILAIYIVACISGRGASNNSNWNAHPYEQGVGFYVAMLFGFIFATFMFDHPLLPPARTVAACGILVLLFKSDSPSKWILSIILLAILAANSSGDKRNAVFLIVSLFLAHTCFPGRNRNGSMNKPAIISIAVVVTVVVFFLVTAMSIMRGYGGYNIDNIFSALLVVPEYLSQPYALGMLSLNFEVGYLFFHAHNAVNSAIQYSDVQIGGESFLKILFFGIPETVFGFKPISILESYTRYYDQGFRQGGGSYVVTIIGEAAWNYGYFAPLALMPIYGSIDWVFFKFKEIGLRSVYFSSILLVYIQYTLLAARGSGLDLFLAYCVLAAGYGMILLLPRDIIHTRRGGAGVAGGLVLGAERRDGRGVRQVRAADGT
jgi:hypothetical protein